MAIWSQDRSAGGYVALYSFLLRLYPASFRAEYGKELSDVFAEQRRQATTPLSIVALWFVEIIDILINSFSAHSDILRQDLRYTARTLMHARGFTLTAIVVTALGIGANTAAFSVIDHVILRPLPFSDPDRLVQFWQQMPDYAQVELSPPNFYDWRKRSTSFEAMSAYTSLAWNFLGVGDPQRLEGAAVTPEFFTILSVQPLLGRVFNEQDSREGADRTVILSFSFWQTAFGGRTDILGKTIRLDSNSYAVIGVMPRNFFFPARGNQAWIPLVLGDPPKDTRTNLYLNAMGKLKPGVSIEKAHAELSVIAGQLALEYPREDKNVGANIVPLGDQLPNQTRLLLWALLGASFCVLLIACTNLANLLLAKAMARRKELTVRTAIGAGRERLVRQLLTESLVLALVGGALGVFIAAAALPLLSAMLPARLPISDVTVLDRRVFAFAILLTMATGLGFGVLPALRICRGVSIEGLREGSRSGVGGRKERLRAGLVITQVTVSIVLLVSAGLLMRALWRVQSIDPGFRADSVLAMQTWLPMPRYALVSTRTAFYTEVLSQVRTLPGVSNAAYISSLPMIPGGGIWPVTTAGTETAERDTGPAKNVGMRIITPGYFDTMGISLRSGRDVSESDNLDAPFVAVVSESFARRYWPGQNPIGRTFHFDIPDFPFARQDRVVVGIAGEVRFRGLERESEPQVYLPYRQLPDRTSTFYSPRELVIRTAANPALLVPSIRRFIQAADPDMPISAVRPLTDVVDLQTASRSTQMRLVVAFAALSIVLAGIGINGLLSFAVGQRTAEFGIRIALGAQSRDILKMVLREGAVLAGVAVVLGLVLSYYAGRSMQALLAGVPPFDPGTLTVAGIVAFAMALLGSLLPAVRAMRTDPATVIRGE